MTPWQDPATISTLLDDTSTWAVVGLGDNPARAAYGVAQVLLDHGKRVVPVHPTATEVLGQRAYPDLASAREAVGPIDVVDVFRRAEEAGPFADQAVEIGARGVWFQLDVVDHEAFERARSAGLLMVMDACPAIEWRRR